MGPWAACLKRGIACYRSWSSAQNAEAIPLDESNQLGATPAQYQEQRQQQQHPGNAYHNPLPLHVGERLGRIPEGEMVAVGVIRPQSNRASLKFRGVAGLRSLHKLARGPAATPAGWKGTVYSLQGEHIFSHHRTPTTVTIKWRPTQYWRLNLTEGHDRAEIKAAAAKALAASPADEPVHFALFAEVDPDPLDEASWTAVELWIGSGCDKVAEAIRLLESRKKKVEWLPEPEGNGLAVGFILPPREPTRHGDYMWSNRLTRSASAQWAWELFKEGGNITVGVSGPTFTIQNDRGGQGGSRGNGMRIYPNFSRNAPGVDPAGMLGFVRTRHNVWHMVVFGKHTPDECSNHPDPNEPGDDCADCHAAAARKHHIPQAYNVPYYRPITGWEPFKIARRVGYAMFGILQGTEINPSFSEEVRQIIQSCGPDKTLVLYCSQGGVLESNETYKRGWQTRSLIAAYDLTQEGISNVQVLKDGYTGYYNSGRDIEILEYGAEEGTEEVAA